jgi:hypothetical protein
VLLAGCGSPRRPSGGWTLIEKASYQTLYAPDGKIDRLLYDKNGDGRAESVTLFGPDGKPTSSQIDTDLDGLVDRWEHLDSSGRLVKLGRAGREAGTPDEWDVFGAAGEIRSREFDEDGNGKVDRAEYMDGGVVYLEELDTDRDGALDRRVFRGPRGEIQRIEAKKGGVWVAP